MIEASETEAASNFHSLLRRVEHGEIIRIHNQGRPVACLVPDVGFMNAREFSAVWEDYRASAADREAADEIAANVKRLDAETAYALAH